MGQHTVRYRTAGGELKEYNYEQESRKIPKEEQKKRGPATDPTRKSNIIKRLREIPAEEAEKWMQIHELLLELEI